jgi:hypothetical protein
MVTDALPPDDSLGAFLPGYTFELQPASAYAFDADIFANIKALYDALPPPPEPIRATRWQLALIKAIVPRTPERQPWEPAPWMTGVPIHIVEDVEESTPWLRKWAASYCEVPFPAVWPGDFGPYNKDQ